MRLVITLGLFILTHSAFAQTDTKRFLEKVTQYYHEIEDIELKMNYFIYDSHTTQKVTETTTGHYIKKGDAYYLKQYGTTMILVNNDLLVKDDSTKMIVLSKTEAKAKERMNQLTASLAAYDKVKELKSRNGNRYIALITAPETPSDIHEVRLEIDEKTLQIKNMTLFYRRQYDVSNDPGKPVFKQPRMHIVYQYFNTHPELKENPFELSQYLTIDSSGNKKIKEGRGRKTKIALRYGFSLFLLYFPRSWWGHCCTSF